MQHNNNNNNNSGSTNNNKYLIIAGIAIIVVIALAIIIPHLKKSSSVDEGGSSTVPGQTQTSATTNPTVSSTSGSAGDDAWKAALGAYKGRTILFGDDCTALPSDQIQALGTKVLLINNGTMPHTIIFGANSGVTIGAKHYKTAIVGGNGTIVVSCDANQKAATITVK